MKQLNRTILESLRGSDAGLPPANAHAYPEKVLQFGTGVLLRGLVDNILNEANSRGKFAGRVLVVKSTEGGDHAAFEEQDHLYSIWTRGLQQGQQIDRIRISNVISRVIKAQSNWAAVLEAAGSPALEIIVSNTTESGIAYDASDREGPAAPASYPGKLLAFLHARFRAFQGDPKAGMVIIATELIPGNAQELKRICVQLAEDWKLSASFLDWFHRHNHFCNSLVDNIVTGKLSETEAREFEQRCGYRDELLVVNEPYRLWAIETGDEGVRQKLSFCYEGSGAIAVPDIDVHRDLKLFLLNATHSLCCGLAIAAGFRLVREAMADAAFRQFAEKLMREEIAPVILNAQISEAMAAQFAGFVLDRFSNPFLDHAWSSIASHYEEKMKMRVAPLVKRYAAWGKEVPERMAQGIAGYLQYTHQESWK